MRTRSSPGSERGLSPALERAERFTARLHEQISEKTVPWRWGTAFLHTGFPKVWDLNLLRIDTPDPDMEPIALAREAEEILGPVGCEHRRIWVPNEELGAELAPGFEELGWEVDVHVVMGHQREPDRLVDTTEVEELGDRTWPSRVEQLRSYPWYDPAIDDQMRGLYDLMVDAANGRDFGIVRDGRAASFALLFGDGETGQIEDVATLDPYRGLGLSRAVMQHALDQSRRRHSFTFLVADDRDWPKEFYSRMGFDALGRHHYFLKTPHTDGTT